MDIWSLYFAIIEVLRNMLKALSSVETDKAYQNADTKRDLKKRKRKELKAKEKEHI